MFNYFPDQRNVNLNFFEHGLGDGKELGLNINYEIQYEPNGIAESFVIGEDFIENDAVSLILGDNIFHGNDFISNINLLGS